MAETIILEVEFNSETAQKRVTSLQKDLNSQRKTLSSLTKAFKAGLISEEEYAENQVKIKQNIKEVRDEQRRLLKNIELEKQANDANTNSREQLNAQYRLAQQELTKLAGTLKRNEDGTIELTENYRLASKQVATAKQAIIDFDQGVNDGRTNVGNYGKAIGKAFDELDGFVVTTKEATGLFSGGFADSVKQGREGFEELSTVIKANPILFLAEVLFRIVQAFAQSERGGQKFQQIFAKLNAVVAPFIDIIFDGIELIVDFVDAILTNFLQLLNFMDDTAIRAGEIVAELQEIERLQAVQNAQSAEALALIEQEKLERDNINNSLEDRLAANEKIFEVETKRAKENEDIAERRLKLLEEQFKELTDTEKTTEKIVELAEARTELAEKQAESAGILTEQITQQVAILQEAADLENQIAQTRLDIQILNGSIREGSRDELSAREQLLKVEQRNAVFSRLTAQERLENGIKTQEDLTDNVISNLAKTNRNVLSINEQTTRDLLQLSKDFNERQASEFEAAQQKIQDAQAERTQREAEELAQREAQELAALELAVLNATQGSEAQLQARVKLIERQTEIEVRQAQLSGNQRALAEKQAEEEILSIRLEFTERRIQAQKELADREAQAIVDGLRDSISTLDAQFSTIVNNEALSYEQRLITLEAFSESQKGLNQELADQEIEIERAKLQALLANENLNREEKLLAEFEFEQRRAEILNEFSNSEIESQQRVADAKRAIGEEEIAFERSKQEAIAGLLGGVAEFLGEETIAFKLFASAQAVINTYLAATQALRSGPTPLLGIAQAALVIANGLASVAKINSVTFADGGIVEGFADGGLATRGGRVKGAGTGRSDSIPARLSNGEGVMVARAMQSNDTFSATGTPRQIAGALNQAFGGRAFQDGGIASLNSGIIAGQSGGVSIESQTDAFLDSVGSQNLFLSITELRDFERDTVEFTEERADQ